MAQFPPLQPMGMEKDEKVEKLKQMFPGVEDIVVEMIMEESHGDFNAAADILLCMSADAEEVGSNGNRFADQAEPNNPFKLASEILLSGESDEAMAQAVPAPTTCTLVSPASTDTIDTVDQLAIHASQWTLSPQKQSGGIDQRRTRREPLCDDKPSTSDLSLKEGLPELVRSFKGGTKILLILRGPPGSGKTTLGKKYIEHLGCGLIFSTDDYFMRKNSYEFDSLKLNEAHQFNQNRVMDALQRQEKLVIVDNTNTMAWEMRPYLAMGAEHGYQIFFQEPDTAWKFNPKELSKRNTHGVPKDKIEIMIGRYEKNLTPECLMEKFEIKMTPSVEHSDKPVEVNNNPEPSENTSLEIFQSDNEDSEKEESTGHDFEDAGKNTTRSNIGAGEIIGQCHLKSNEIFEDPWTQPPEEEEVTKWDPDPADNKPKPRRKTRQPRAKQKKDQIDITNLVFDEVPVTKAKHVEKSTALPKEEAQRDQNNDPSMSLSIDPLFAVQLQEAFGPPLEDSLLQFLDTDEILSAKIPYNLAYQFYVCWQTSLMRYLASRPDRKVMPDIKSETEFPRTVLAPNAVKYYEDQMLMKAKNDSLLSLQPKKKPQIVVKSRSADRVDNRSQDEFSDELEHYKNKRNQLYRKAISARSNSDRVISAYYAEEARKVGRDMKAKQKERQMDFFMNTNEDMPLNKLDLHFLCTADAIKQLQFFIQTKEDRIRNDRGENHCVEVVTGRGSRSENGKSKIRPAVENWLQQKNYRFSEVNSGAIKVHLKKS